VGGWHEEGGRGPMIMIYLIFFAHSEYLDPSSTVKSGD